jgi:hypothetical protein
LGRFIVSLLAKEIRHRGQVFIQIDALSPTAVDIVKHALERPQARQQTKDSIVGQFARALGPTTASIGVAVASHRFVRLIVGREHARFIG